MSTSSLSASGVALVVVLETLAGCASCGGSGAPEDGGTLTFSVDSDAGCVDPQQMGGNDSIYPVRQLTDQDPRTSKIVPWPAESPTVSDDARSFTFTPRPGVGSSDGTPPTAKTVK